MNDYVIRYRNLSGATPMSPLRDQISANNEQAAIAALKQRHPEQYLRIEHIRRDTPAPKKRKTRAEWIVLAIIVVIGGINLLTRTMQ